MRVSALRESCGIPFTFARFENLHVNIRDIYRFLSRKYQNVFLDYPVDMQPRYGHGKQPNSALFDLINSRRVHYASLLEKVLSYSGNLQAIRHAQDETDASRPGWNNGFLPGLDIAVLYSMIAEKRPGRYVEVGSGNSTKVARMAVVDHGLSTRITSIDPMPRAEIDQLAHEVIRQPFESVDLQSILSLERGDILFIDNSHRILPNSDATVFFLEVLPQLREGVIVHIHDIYLPFDYPQFMCDRAYSEQYGLAIAMLSNPERFVSLCPNYFISEDHELSAILKSLWEHPNLTGVEQHGGSFWLEIA